VKPERCLVVLRRDLEVLHTSDGDSPVRVFLAVGWLEGSIPRSGATSERFRALLGELCREPPVNTYKPGFHPCQFGQCRQRYESGESFIGGNGEIYVPGREGVLYNAPVLISHYVSDHGYRPPDEFIKAVLALEGPKRVAVGCRPERLWGLVVGRVFSKAT
jgi:hypothetical protein